MHKIQSDGVSIHAAPFVLSGEFEGLDWLLACSPRAAPRVRLHGPHTTSISLSLIGRPCSYRFHASGVWSACKSLVAPQSEQNVCSFLARFDSRLHAPV